MEAQASNTGGKAMRTKQFLSVLAALIMAGVFAAEGSSVEEARQLIQDGRWEEAAAAYEEITRAEPENAGHWTNLGLAYRSLERYEKAVSAYEKALDIDETSNQGLAGMAVSLEKLGETDKAFRYLDAAAKRGLSPRMLEDHPAFAGLREHARFAETLETARRAASPCLHGERHDDFDFWVGDWDVMIAGQKRAENRITREMNGCIIRERYSNQFGYQGESINYFDPESGKWKQNWVDSRGGVVRYEGGLREEGVMVMEGANTSVDGSTQLARVTWTRLPDGRVRHVIEQSGDGGRTWSTYFDGTYVKSGRSAGEGGGG